MFNIGVTPSIQLSFSKLPQPGLGQALWHNVTLSEKDSLPSRNSNHGREITDFQVQYRTQPNESAFDFFYHLHSITESLIYSSNVQQVFSPVQWYQLKGNPWNLGFYECSSFCTITIPVCETAFHQVQISDPVLQIVNFASTCFFQLKKNQSTNYLYYI